MAIASKNTVISLETKNGDRLEIGSALMNSSITFDVQDLDDPVFLNPRGGATLRVAFFADLGATPLFSQDSIAPHEWRCPYCGHINPDSYSECGIDDLAMGCARPKSAIHKVT